MAVLVNSQPLSPPLACTYPSLLISTRSSLLPPFSPYSLSPTFRMTPPALPLAPTSPLTAPVYVPLGDKRDRAAVHNALGRL